MKALLSKFRDSIALNRTTNNFLRFEAFFFTGAPVARVVNGKDKKLLRYVFFPNYLTINMSPYEHLINGVHTPLLYVHQNKQKSRSSTPVHLNKLNAFPF